MILRGPLGTPVAGAGVHVLNTHLSILTDDHGQCRLAPLPPGHYQASVSARGYADKLIDFFIAVREHDTLNFYLERSVQQLDEVLVTAGKKEENSQALAVAVTTISAQETDAFRLWNGAALTGFAPNLYAANPGDGRNVISIRGITSTSYDPAVLTTIDGVTQFSLDTYMPQLFDVERIEILRGPQGTLYGRNALGGVINVITREAGDRPSGYASLSAGSKGLHRLTAAYGIPLIKKKLWFRVAALYEGMRGFYHNDFTGRPFDRQHRIALNAELKYRLNEHWQASLGIKKLFNRNDGAFPLQMDVATAKANPFQVDQDAVGKMVDNSGQTSLLIKYAGTQMNFRSQTSFQSNERYYRTPVDADFSPLDGLSIVNNYGHPWNRVSVWTQEFTLSSPAAAAARWQWTTGLFFFHESAPGKQGTRFGKDAALFGSPDSNYTIVSTNILHSAGLAGYGQISYRISRRMQLTGGIRFDAQSFHEKISAVYQADGRTDFITQPDTAGKTSASAWSPMAALSYALGHSTRLYATYSRGFRTGGLTPLSADPSQSPLYAYKPEFSNNVEIGLKSSLPGHRADWQLAAFFAEVRDVQVPTLILPQAVTVTSNAGNLRSKGVEADLRILVVRGLQASWHFGYTSALYQRPSAAQNGEPADYTGHHQVFTPASTSLLTLQYQAAINRKKTVYFLANSAWSAIGKTYYDPANTLEQGSYQLVSGSIGIRYGHLEATIWSSNLTGTKYISYAYAFGVVHLGDPAVFGSTVRFSF